MPDILGIGDSMMDGTGSSNNSTGISLWVASRMGWTYRPKLATGGGRIADAQHQVPVVTVAGGINDNYIVEFGANDQRFNWQGQTTVDQFKAALLYYAVMLSLSSAEKARAYEIVYTPFAKGSKTGDNWQPNQASQWVTFFTNNIHNGQQQTHTATSTAYGDVVYVGFRYTLNTAATVQISIDGVDKGTFTLTPPAGVVSSLWNWTESPVAFRFAGLSNAQHTVVITVISTNSGLCFFDFVCGNRGYTGNADPARVFLMHPPKMKDAAAYSTNGGSEANILALGQACEDIATLLQGDDLRVYAVNPNPHLVPATDYIADGLHPNDTGYGHIADAFEDAINGSNPNDPPLAFAGADRNLAANVSQVTINDATASDPDGSVASTVWTQTSGQAATITNGTTLAPTFSNLAVGVSVFRLRVTDNLGAFTDDTVQVTRAAPPPFNVTSSKATHRAGSVRVPGDAVLPVITATGATGTVTFSDNGAGGTFSNVTNNGGGNWSATYTPRNWTRDGSHPRAPLVLITATDAGSGGSGSVSIAVVATFPQNPNVGYPVDLDDGTKVSYARDQTPAFDEVDDVTLGWSLEMRNREPVDVTEVRKFWLHHRKTIMFYYSDLELGLLELVRFDSGVRTVVDGADTYRMTCVVKAKADVEAMLAA